MVTYGAVKNEWMDGWNSPAWSRVSINGIFVFVMGRRGCLEVVQGEQDNHLPGKSERHGSSPIAPSAEVLVGGFEPSIHTRGRGHYTAGWNLVHRKTHDRGNENTLGILGSASSPLPRTICPAFASFDGPHDEAAPPPLPSEIHPPTASAVALRTVRCPFPPSSRVFVIPQPVAFCSGSCRSQYRSVLHAACCNL